MADKIVILEDSEGNNIYPISRGLATNSVDTNAIQNGAVTSAKIDWATINYNSTDQLIGNGPVGFVVYRKCLSGDGLSGGSNISIPVTFAHLAATFVKVDVVLKNRTNTSTTIDSIPPYYSSSSDYFRAFMRWTRATNTTTLELRVPGGVSTFDYFAVIEYLSPVS